MSVSRSTRRRIDLHELLVYVVFLFGIVYGLVVIYTVVGPW